MLVVFQYGSNGNVRASYLQTTCAYPITSQVALSENIQIFKTAP